MTERGSYIYVVGGQEGPRKIGIASKPRMRLYQLRTASYLPLELEYLARCEPAAAKEIETVVHGALAVSREYGEWFQVSAEQAAAAIAAAASSLGHAITEVSTGDCRRHRCGARPTSGAVVVGGKITPRQCRAARALLGWTQPQLSEQARIALRTLIDFESGARTASRGTRISIAHALLENGVNLLEDEDVSMRRELEAA